MRSIFLMKIETCRFDAPVYSIKKIYYYYFAKYSKFFKYYSADLMYTSAPRFIAKESFVKTL